MAFNKEEQEAWNDYAWQRLIELGMATEEYEKAMKENPEPGDQQEYTEIAVEEADTIHAPGGKSSEQKARQS